MKTRYTPILPETNIKADKAFKKKQAEEAKLKKEMAAKVGSKGGPLQGGGIKKYDTLPQALWS